MKLGAGWHLESDTGPRYRHYWHGAKLETAHPSSPWVTPPSKGLSLVLVRLRFDYGWGRLVDIWYYIIH